MAPSLQEKWTVPTAIYRGRRHRGVPGPAVDKAVGTETAVGTDILSRRPPSGHMKPSAQLVRWRRRHSVPSAQDSTIFIHFYPILHFYVSIYYSQLNLICFYSFLYVYSYAELHPHKITSRILSLGSIMCESCFVLSHVCRYYCKCWGGYWFSMYLHALFIPPSFSWNCFPPSYQCEK